MRRRWTTAVAASCGLLAGCSLVTSWDGLGSGGAAAHDAGQGGAGATVGAGGDTGQGGATSDAGNDSAPDVNVPPTCVEEHHYCGGHVIKGTSTKLYVCNGGGSTTLLEACAHGCLVRPLPKDDFCRCFTGGFYCGGDHIEGDPSTLYKCNMDGSGTLFQSCTKGCIVTPGKDDSCG